MLTAWHLKYRNRDIQCRVLMVRVFISIFKPWKKKKTKEG